MADADLRPVNQTRRFATLRVIAALIVRDMSTTYGRSPGGYLWAVLEPVGGITLMVILFSFGFRSPPLGTNFPIFFATGIVPFVMYMQISNKVASALVFSKQLLVYPSVTFVDALIARFILEVITQLMVSYLVITGILLMFETQTALHLPSAMLAYTMLFVFALGVGVMNAFLQTMFQVWARFWTIINRPMVLLSGVIFIPERVPEPYRSYLLYNPIVHFIAQMRKAYYPYYAAPYIDAIYVFGAGAILTALGMVFLLRYHRDLLHK